MATAQQFGKYTLLDRIAVGGMAEIFRAKAYGAEGFEREICIKRILPTFNEDPDFVAMFIDEAQVASRLQHANIAQIHDFDKIEGQYYIAMELVEGKDLRRLLHAAKNAGTRISVDLGVFVTSEILKGLHYAHSRKVAGRPLGLIHRDISPHNVLVSFSGEVKITDFGIAKAISRASSTRSGVIKGKTAYMAPEQASGAGVDQRTDLFATGVVMYELCTGERPFVGDSDAELLVRVQKADYRPPIQVRPDLSPAVDEVIRRLMTKSPANRYQTASEALRAVASLPMGGGAIALADMMTTLFAPPAHGPKERTEVRERPSGAAGDSPIVASDAGAATHTRLPDAGVALLPTLVGESGAAAVGAPADQTRGVTGSLPLGVGDLSTQQLSGRRGRWIASGFAALAVAAGIVAWLGTRPTKSHTPAAVRVVEPASVSPTEPAPVPALPGIIESDTASGARPPSPTLVPSAAATMPDGESVGAARGARAPASLTAAERARLGTLTINVTPWAFVFEGEKRYGMTPIMSTPLTPGPHTFILENLPLKIHRAYRVQIRAGHESHLTVHLP